MTFDYAIPKTNAAVETPAAELLMDEEAFTAFYQRTARPLWAYLARVSGDAALADDLLQESYLHFLGAANPVKGEVACRRYLFRIATNLLRDHWRRPKHTQLTAVAEGAWAADNRESHRVEAEAVLDTALANMRPRDKQLLWLAYAEGYTHREIAEITGLGAASIRLLLFRAKRKVTRSLRQTLAARRNS